jgi:hypothetical protein
LLQHDIAFAATSSRFCRISVVHDWTSPPAQGYCHEGGSKCQRFPVLVGEIGSRMRDCRNPCNNRGEGAHDCMKDEMQARVRPHLKPYDRARGV